MAAAVAGGSGGRRYAVVWSEVDGAVRRLGGTIPRLVLGVSSVFYAFVCVPVHVLLALLCSRLYLEMFFSLVAFGSPLHRALPCLYVLAFGSLHATKILVDSFWDFLSFRTVGHPGAVLNPDARAKARQLWEWSHELPLGGAGRRVAVPVGLAVTGACLVVTALAARLGLGADAFCCAWLASVLGLAVLYLQAQVQTLGLAVYLADTTGPGPALWNEAVINVRILGLLGALVGALLAPLFQSYSAPLAIEPFLIISSGMAFYFCLLRFITDVALSALDVHLHFAWTPRLAYLALVVGALARAALVYGEPAFVLFWGFATASWFHCAVECAARVQPRLSFYLFRPRRPGEPGAGPGAASPGSLLQRLSNAAQATVLVLGVPFVPLAAVLVATTTPWAVLRWALSTAAAVAGATALLWPEPVRRLGGGLAWHLHLLIAGTPFFYGEARRRAFFALPETAGRRHRGEQDGSASARGPRIRRRDVFAVCSTVVWFLALLTQGCLIEHRLRPPIVEEYDTRVRAEPGGALLAPESGSNATDLVFRFRVAQFHTIAEAHLFGQRRQEAPQPGSSQPGLVGGDDSDANPLCHMRVRGVRLPEYALLASAAYMVAQPGQDHLTPTLLSDWTIRHHGQSADVAPVRFFDFFSAAHNLSVIAIKGTTVTSPFDWLRDVDLWLEAFLFSRVAPAFLPGILLWPHDLRARAIAAISVQSRANRPAFYHGRIVDYVSSIQDRDVVIIGHSLGGGIAKYASAFTNRSAISFSGPGMLEISQKLSIDKTAFKRWINVFPTHDIVPHCGTITGTVFQWDCSHNWLSCHVAVQLPCALATHVCPDFRPHLGCAFRRLG